MITLKDTIIEPFFIEVTESGFHLKERVTNSDGKEKIYNHIKSPDINMVLMTIVKKQMFADLEGNTLSIQQFVQEERKRLMLLNSLFSPELTYEPERGPTDQESPSIEAKPKEVIDLQQA